MLMRKAQLYPEIFMPALQTSIKHLPDLPPNTLLKRIQKSFLDSSMCVCVFVHTHTICVYLSPILCEFKSPIECISIISTLERLRSKDHKFKGSMGRVVASMYE